MMRYESLLRTIKRSGTADYFTTLAALNYADRPEPFPLPPEYRGVKYLQSTGTQYIELRNYIFNNYRLYVTFEVTQIVEDSWICGYANTWYGALYGFGMINGQFYKNHEDMVFTPDVLATGRKTEGYMKLWNYAEHLYFFARNWDGSPDHFSYCKIYYARVEDEAGRPEAELIPCIRKSDGVAGMYDLVR